MSRKSNTVARKQFEYKSDTTLKILMIKNRMEECVHGGGQVFDTNICVLFVGDWPLPAPIPFSPHIGKFSKYFIE